MRFLALYLFKRFSYTVGVLFAVSLIVFGVTQAMPGTVAHTILGNLANEEAVKAINEQLGLNRPLYIQYLDWIGGVLTGDWGQSFTSRQQVSSMVLPRLVRSAELAVIAFLQIGFFGIVLGTIAAVKRNTFIDSLAGGVSYIGVSVPEFVTSLVLIALLAQGQWEILPQSGYVPRSEGFIPWLSHLILPSIAAALLGISHVMRQTRSGMVEALQSEYVRTARLKGMSETKVIVKHALRNGLLESITVLALSMGWLIGSLVVIEEVFAYPGLGRLIILSINAQDIPVVQIGILIIATVYSIGNLCADILYSVMDPRIDYE